MPEDRDMERVLRLLTYGLYVITSARDGAEGAVLTPWLSQVSTDPVAIGFSVRKDTPVHELLFSGAPLVVNVLRAGQRTLAESFLGEAEGDALRGHARRVAENGCPYLAEALAIVECEGGGSLDTGRDFTLFVGNLTSARILSEGQPLTLRQTGLQPF